MKLAARIVVLERKQWRAMLTTSLIDLEKKKSKGLIWFKKAAATPISKAVKKKREEGRERERETVLSSH